MLEGYNLKKMKKFYFLLAVVACTLLTSCFKDVDADYFYSIAVSYNEDSFSGDPASEVAQVYNDLKQAITDANIKETWVEKIHNGNTSAATDEALKKFNAAYKKLEAIKTEYNAKIDALPEGLSDKFTLSFLLNLECVIPEGIVHLGDIGYAFAYPKE